MSTIERPEATHPTDNPAVSNWLQAEAHSLPISNHQANRPAEAAGSADKHGNILAKAGFPDLTIHGTDNSGTKMSIEHSGSPLGSLTPGKTTTEMMHMNGNSSEVVARNNGDGTVNRQVTLTTPDGASTRVFMDWKTHKPDEVIQRGSTVMLDSETGAVTRVVLQAPDGNPKEERVVNYNPATGKPTTVELPRAHGDVTYNIDDAGHATPAEPSGWLGQLDHMFAPPKADR